MSLGGKKDGNNYFDLFQTICIGVAIIVFGLSVANDSLTHYVVLSIIITCLLILILMVALMILQKKHRSHDVLR